jgi:malate dehydrogenase (oxaloacetate-decarboxylating)
MPKHSDNDTARKALELHETLQGKIELGVKHPLQERADLSLLYTPGVAAASQAIADDPSRVWSLTARQNWVAVVSDGSAVLGLGNIGPQAAIPVMEGKAVLFKEFAGVDAFPICVNTQDTDEIVAIVTAMAPSFGGINLEDISAPRCFEIEKRLRESLDIPVFHDDQHGTAIVVTAGLINALSITGRTFQDSRFVVSGAGAAGMAIVQMLLERGASNILVADRQGILHKNREQLSPSKSVLAQRTNPQQMTGPLEKALAGADVFIGVSAPGLVTGEMVASMAQSPIVFAMANPVPEIYPEEALAAGAAIVATGRSDFPNQINNVLAFPGLFRGLLDERISQVTPEIHHAAANALAGMVRNPSTENIIPDAFNPSVAQVVAQSVKKELTLDKSGFFCYNK